MQISFWFHFLKHDVSNRCPRFYYLHVIGSKPCSNTVPHSLSLYSVIWTICWECTQQFVCLTLAIALHSSHRGTSHSIVCTSEVCSILSLSLSLSLSKYRMSVFVHPWTPGGVLLTESMKTAGGLYCTAISSVCSC